MPTSYTTATPTTGALRSGVRTTRSPLSRVNRSTGYFVAGIFILRATVRIYPEIVIARTPSTRPGISPIGRAMLVCRDPPETAGKCIDDRGFPDPAVLRVGRGHRVAVPVAARRAGDARRRPAGPRPERRPRGPGPADRRAHARPRQRLVRRAAGAGDRRVARRPGVPAGGDRDAHRRRRLHHPDRVDRPGVVRSRPARPEAVSHA